MSRKKLIIATGDVFAVPLSDGTFGLGHIVDENDGEPFCALFATRGTAPSDLLDNLQDSLQRPITILELTNSALERGEWPIIANEVGDYSQYRIPTDGKGKSHTCGIGQLFLQACHGLTPWDEMHDPKYYEKKLIPGVHVPPTIRYKSDFEESAFGTSSKVRETENRSPAPVNGPGEIEIQISYGGSGMPNKNNLSIRNKVERRLEELGVGEVNGADAGDGVMSIYLETENVFRSMPLVTQTLDEFGISERTSIETSPAEDGDENC